MIALTEKTLLQQTLRTQISISSCSSQAPAFDIDSPRALPPQGG